MTTSIIALCSWARGYTLCFLGEQRHGLHELPRASLEHRARRHLRDGAIDRALAEADEDLSTHVDDGDRSVALPGALQLVAHLGGGAGGLLDVLHDDPDALRLQIALGLVARPAPRGPVDGRG